MTDIFENTTDRAEILVARAVKVFGVTSDALEEAVDRLKAEEAIKGAQITKDLRDLNAAMMLALQMEGKARDAEIERQSGVGAGQLDLNAARDEIGCRLACLRNARSGGNISE